MKPALSLAFIFALLIFGTVLVPGADAGGDKPVKHVNAKEAEKLVAEKKVIVIDIRTPEEFKKEGHISGATNIDFYAADFEKRIGQLDKGKTYLVHCAAGGRSTKSLAAFKKQQIQSLYHLDGGLNAWKKDGLPVEK